MSRWLKVHQVLLAGALLLLAVQALLYVLVLQPKKQELLKARQEVVELQKRLSRSSWPTQSDWLAAYANELQQVLGDAERGEGLAARSQAVMAKASRTYAPYVKKGYETRANLVRSVSLLDYQSEYTRVCQELSARGVQISPSVLKLRDDTSSPYVYQLMLHIWAVEKLAGQVLAAGLRIAGDHTVKVATSAGASLPAAGITAEPMLALVSSEASRQPYLLGFPVRVVADGSLDQVLAFLASLDGPELFFPVRGFELTTLPPTSMKADSAGLLVSNTLRLEVECVAFFVLDGNGEP